MSRLAALAPLLGLGLLAAAPGVPAAGPCDPAPGERLPPSADLYCMELTPVPGVAGRARLELGRLPGPFTVAVTPDGRMRYAPVLLLEGVPEPSAAPAGYVAWLVTPTFDVEARLGVVRPGATPLPEIDLDKFMVLVTAESDTAVAERSGRLVFRGASPSTRMQPADVMEFALGSMVPTGTTGGGGMPGMAEPPGSAPMPGLRGGGDHDGHGGGAARGAAGGAAGDGWILPPMPEGIGMLPSMMRLRPEVSPWLPGDPGPPGGEEGGEGEGGAAALESGMPPPLPARPREVVRLADGDTLALEATVVERSVGGHRVRMYAYNGQYPGPLLWVPRGATVTVDFTNRIDQPTTVHWHGLRLDNASDGVPGVTQDAVLPGETFRYTVRFPDPGLYWYHPHVREDVQQGMGLYGNMMVRDGRGDWFGPAHREEVLMLDDLLMGDAGPVPFGRERATHGFMGRFGNVFLVNGEPGWTLDVRRGEVVRFFLTNVANTRTFNLAFAGPGGVDAPLEVVGSDVGSYEREARIGSVVIAPAERYVVNARFDRPGTYRLVNRVRGIDHLFGAFFPEADTLGEVRVAAEPATPDLSAALDAQRAHPWVSEDIDAVRVHFDRPVDRELELVLETGDLPFVVERLMQFDSAYFHPVEWSGTMPMMNWASTSREARWHLLEPSTGRTDMDIRWDFRRGEVAKVRIHNRRRTLHAMQHPIHFHGQRFLVLAVNGVPDDNLVWKDTVLVPVGATLDLLLELSNPGEWMAHCHIAEHLEGGMMMGFGVR